MGSSIEMGSSEQDCIIVHDDDSDDEVFVEKVNFDELDSFPHIIKFIKKLQNHIHLQKRNIDELQRAIKNYKLIDRDKNRDKTDAEAQTEPESSNWVVDDTKNGFSIADQVTETAESAMLQTGFAYEETSGLYYHYNSGYYYDPASGLYYNGNTGTYYSFDSKTNTYKFHSKVTTSSTQRKRKVNSPEEDLEEGECTTESDSNCSSESEEEKSYPPCIRIIVKETNLTNLKVGTLFLVTCTGGTIGREGSGHCVVVPDINTSKHHARFQYNKGKQIYEIIDLGSRNGTFLNGKRISAAKQESEPQEIEHETILQIGGTKLDCHIHNGNETCERCEPGLLQLNSAGGESSAPLKIQHKSELKRLKSKFGLEKASKPVEGYRDRAQARRENVGSSSQHDKTEQSSLDTSIPKNNMGFKMLAKMGWSEGQALGKEGEGISEPVPLIANLNRAGIGNSSGEVSEMVVDSSEEKKRDIWKKAQERFNNIQD